MLFLSTIDVVTAVGVTVIVIVVVVDIADVIPKKKDFPSQNNPSQNMVEDSKSINQSMVVILILKISSHDAGKNNQVQAQ